MTTVRWRPDRVKRPPPWPVPPLFTALARGVGGQCPACGKAPLFEGFLGVAPACRKCSAPLGQARADDAPPYFVMVATALIVIPPLWLAQKFDLASSWELAAIFLPVTLALALALLRPIKGGIIGVILAMDMLQSEPKPE